MRNTTIKLFAGERVLVVGMGRYPLGSSMSAVRFFLRQGARVTVTDDKPRRSLAAGLRLLRGLPVRLVLGRYRTEDFRRADIVFHNQIVRVPPRFRNAMRPAAALMSEIDLFMSLYSGKAIGITGTRGKSTTTSLVGAMFRAAHRPALVGGNIKISPLSFIEKARRATAPVILELSSWQLEGFVRSPRPLETVVITNIFPDHLNTYPSMAAYVNAKANIFRRQGKHDAAVISRDNAAARILGSRVLGRRFWFSKKSFPTENGSFVRAGKISFRENGKTSVVARVSDVRYLIGEHNLENVLAAVTVAKIHGLSNAAVVKTLRTFRGLPDRLEFVRSVGGVRFYNDTTATSPDGAIAGLAALAGSTKSQVSSSNRTVLIAGGTDKKLEFGDFAKAIKKYAKSLVLIDGTATERLVWELKQIKYPIDTIPIVKEMKLAVTLAREKSKKGDTVLLSPGAASFGIFANEFDRGEQFVKVVRKLK